NVHHLSAAGKYAPKKDDRRQRVLMEDCDARTGPDAKLLQPCCNLSALQIKSAKADALVWKDGCSLLRKTLCSAGKQVGQRHFSRPWCSVTRSALDDQVRPNTERHE